MKHLSLEEPTNTHQFLRDSIFQFVSLLLVAGISINALQPVGIGLVIAQYTGYTLSKFIVWLVVSKDQPLTHKSHPAIIRIKTIFLIDFNEAWKLDKIKNYELKPVFAMIFNGVTLINIIITVLFIEDFLNYSLLMIQVADSNQTNQWLSFLFSLLLISLTVSSNLSYINIFKLNQGYTMNSTRQRLSLIYLFCIQFSQVFLTQQLFSLSIIIGILFILFRLTLAITYALWIAIQNPAAISKANFMFSNTDSANRKKRHIGFILFMSILSGQTIDIAPFYRSFPCEYDKFISHYTARSLRVISAVESIAALIVPAVWKTEEGLEYFSSITIVVTVINSASVLFHICYGIICILQGIKYPRCKVIQINNLTKAALQRIDTHDSHNGQDYQIPLLDNFFDMQNFSTSCFQSNSFLETIEFSGDFSPAENEQRVVDVLIGLWRDPLLSNSQINLSNQYIMANCCGFSHLFLTKENISLILASMRTNSMIVHRKNLFITIPEALDATKTQEFGKMLIKHAFEINTLTISAETDNKSEKYNGITRQFEIAKHLSIRHSMLIACYFKTVAPLMSVNPHYILYDLYE